VGTFSSSSTQLQKVKNNGSDIDSVADHGTHLRDGEGQAERPNFLPFWVRFLRTLLIDGETSPATRPGTSCLSHHQLTVLENPTFQSQAHFRCFVSGSYDQKRF
jgi:hypothetical protein